MLGAELVVKKAHPRQSYLLRFGMTGASKPTPNTSKHRTSQGTTGAGWVLRLGAHYADGFLANMCHGVGYCAIGGYMIVAGHGDAHGMESIHGSHSVAAARVAVRTEVLNACWPEAIHLGRKKGDHNIFGNCSVCSTVEPISFWGVVKKIRRVQHGATI